MTISRHRGARRVKCSAGCRRTARDAAPGRARVPHPQNYGVCDSEGVERGTCGRKCRCRRCCAERKRNCGAGRGISARTEAAQPADAVGHNTFLNEIFPCTAHIGILFSGVVRARRLAFFRARTDSLFFTFEFAVTPPPAAAARLDRAPVLLPESKCSPDRKPAALRRAPARADHPFKGIALVLLSTVFLGTSDVTSKYLSATLPSIEITWIRF